MSILLKETVLKLMKSVAPNLYKQRFYEDLVLQIVNDYLKGVSNK